PACVFFFQAEDGIRDFHVTGVQTCALPISILNAPTDDQPLLVARAEEEAWSVARLEREVSERSRVNRSRGGRPRSPEYVKSIRRSEERRVGKAWRTEVARGTWHKNVQSAT